MKVKIKPLFEGTILPSYATDGSGCMDIYACLNRPEKLHPGERKAIPTGWAVEIPLGYALKIEARSGLAVKHDVQPLAGIIDSDYRGEVKVVLYNRGEDPFFINPGAKIAQCWLKEVIDIEWEEVNELSKTDRGEGGFGSTGS